MINEIMEMNTTLLCVIAHSNQLGITVEELLKQKKKVHSVRVESLDPYMVIIKYGNTEEFECDFSEGMEKSKITTVQRSCGYA